LALNALPEASQKRETVRRMFDRIASRYDGLNRLLTLGLDQRWRGRALADIAAGPGDRLIDLACGTGDLAERAAARGARVIGADFAGEMLRTARKRGVDARLVQADAAALPFPSACATVLVCGFALRNFENLPDVLGEMARVLEPGGRLALLEVDRPSSAWIRAAHGLYFDRVVPRVGGWLSDTEAYAYLPQSTAYLPSAEELRALLEKSGFQQIRKTRLLLGAAQILQGVRA